jgi:hypothetical protein
MRYLPATAASLAVGAAVCVALYFTKEPACLFGLSALGIVYWLTP